uniref:3-hydroxy-3-methylglutaryl-coenzyme A reductase n=1 Tax=Meloidogyne enterolobii TaxID=390850 RepID=A0A6V7TWN9_MELEN|nr:unnamed protein product [Meloidogyne enterolobii]
MIFLDEFTDELILFLESLITRDIQVKGIFEQWKMQLRDKVLLLANKYFEENRGGGAKLEFALGNDSELSTVSTTSPTITKDQELTSNSIAKSISAVDLRLLREMREGRLKHRNLEQHCCSSLKAVELRRIHLEERYRIPLAILPYENYNYDEVKNACCENVIGYMPVPTGVAGPLYFDGEMVPIPLSTTEGALVASVSRGCLCLNESMKSLGTDAFYTQVIRDGMSRAPVLEFDSIKDCYDCFQWVRQNESFEKMKLHFDQTSRYANLQRVDPRIEGNYLFLRFVATTGDAMGMNMVTRGTGKAIECLRLAFPQARLLSISGNLCVDKKASALNWIEGRGKSVVAEAFIPAQIVERVLKTNVDSMVAIGHAKLLVGSSAACTIGGWNAHAANVVASLFIATGQDAAQTVSSSMCMTQLNKRALDGALHISCTMNCLEVGAIGGGTMLSPQSKCLEILGCRRDILKAGQNSERLARIVCGVVLAGELSLLASQCNEGELEKSHLRLNRSSRNLMLSDTSNTPPLLSPVHCRRASSAAVIPQSIPESLPISLDNVSITEGRRQNININRGNESTTGSSALSVLTQTGTKLLKKANNGHMPCGPL